MLLNVILLIAVFKKYLPGYPIGWDVPYYISRAKYFLIEGVLGKRAASIIIGAAVSKITGLSLVTVFYYYSIGLIVSLAGVTALLASKIFSGIMRHVSFMVLFTFGIWSVKYFTLSITTLDNALALILSILLLYVLTFEKLKYKTFLVLCISVLIAVAHFETLMFTIMLLFIYTILVSIFLHMNPGTFISKTKHSLTALGTLIVVGSFYWLDQIQNTLGSYINPTLRSKNASISYTDNSTLREFFRLSHSGTASTGQLFLYIFAVVAIVFYLFRIPKEKERNVLGLFALFLATQAVLFVTVFRGAIPTNRATALLPISLLVSFAVVVILDTLKSRTSLLFLLPIFWLFLLTTQPITDQVAYARRFPLSIEPKTYQALQELSEYSQSEAFPEFVIATNISTTEKAASAYFNLWHNWIISVLPLPSDGYRYCVYFGDIHDILQRKPTIRGGEDTEYSLISNYSYNACSLSAKDAPIFFVDGMYNVSETHLLDNNLLTQVAEGLYILQ